MIRPHKQPPCADCDEREPGCHDRCAGYKQWKLDNDKYVAGIKKQRENEQAIESVAIERTIKINKQA